MKSKPVLLYDGQCPFCASYVELLRLRESFPDLQLVDAREAVRHPALAVLQARGLKIDDGMALIDGDTIHHGAASIHALADRGTARTWFGRINRAVFRSAKRSAALYPILRGGRNLVLRLLGQRKLGF